MKVATLVLSVLGTLFFLAALVIACLPSAAVRQLVRRVFGSKDRL